MGRISELWHLSDDNGKVKMLKRALDRNITLHADLLKEDIQTLDRLAKGTGLVPVYITVVDMAGMRDLDPGVASPLDALRLRPRKWCM